MGAPLSVTHQKMTGAARRVGDNCFKDLYLPGRAPAQPDRESLEARMARVSRIRSNLARAELMTEYLNIALHARGVGRREVAADYCMRVLEADLKDGTYTQAVLALNMILSQDIQLEEEALLKARVAGRFHSYMKRTEFSPKLGDNANLYLFLAAINIKTPSNIPTVKVFELGARVLNEFPDFGGRQLLAQEVLYQGRVIERATGQRINRGHARKAAEIVAADFARFRDNLGIVHTIAIDLAYFEYSDLMEGLLREYKDDKELALLRSLAYNYRTVRELLSRGEKQNAVALVREAIAEFESAPETENFAYLETAGIWLRLLALRATQEGIEASAFADLRFRGSKLDGHIGDLAKVQDDIRLRGELIELARKNLFLLGVESKRRKPNYLVAKVDSSGYRTTFPFEKGEVSLYFDAENDTAVLAISLKDCNMPCVCFPMALKERKIVPFEFNGQHSLWLICMVARSVFAIAYNQIEADESQNKVDLKIKEAITAANEAEKKKKALQVFIQYFQSAHEELFLREVEMLERYYPAAEVALRLQSAYDIPTIRYRLGPKDILHTFVEEATIIRDPHGAFRTSVKLRSAEALAFTELSFAVNLGSDSAELLSPQAAIDANPQMAQFSQHVMALTAEVVSSYIGMRLSKWETYRGYVVNRDDEAWVLDGSVSHKNLGPDDVFSLAFNEVLTARGILGVDWYFVNAAGYYEPLADQSLEGRKKALAEGRASDLHVMRQITKPDPKSRRNIARLRIAKRAKGADRFGLSSYEPTPEAIRQKELLLDDRLFPTEGGLYVITLFKNGDVHVLPVKFAPTEESFFTPDSNGQEPLLTLEEEIAKGTYKDPGVLLKTTDPAKREKLQRLIQSGEIQEQKAQTYKVYYTYRPPRFFSVQELLSKGFALEGRG